MDTTASRFVAHSQEIEKGTEVAEVTSSRWPTACRSQSVAPHTLKTRCASVHSNDHVVARSIHMEQAHVHGASRGNASRYSHAQNRRAAPIGRFADRQDRGDAPSDDNPRNEHIAFVDACAVDVDALIGSGGIIGRHDVGRAGMEDRTLYAAVAR
jgi:hypothetical protein